MNATFVFSLSSRLSKNIISSFATMIETLTVLNVTSPQKKQKKSQGSSRYRTGGDVELTALPLLKGICPFPFVFVDVIDLGGICKQNTDFSHQNFAMS